ncbi:hypothetical protein SAMN05444358_11315 [Ruegeria halocynthiae]|uniref:SPW repeat-containing protein n=1 Tax=Ruegeria halocynthiae TaxID=985054 RepID=A0A1H3F2E5_9RHOB|nr:DUF6632 domain-containing protein [Ruegeria halocynthiae]SDX85055.1 hypothetical protein SAMN05444358_11315 [Ruegeria halocynthiae]
MSPKSREKGLKIALVLFGTICFLIYPLAAIWPSGWVWHGGGGQHYFQMICGIYAVLGWFLIRASSAPQNHMSLISFAIWSSIIHAVIMAIQVSHDHMEIGHLVGDIPALIIMAAVLWYLSPRVSETPRASERTSK